MKKVFGFIKKHKKLVIILVVLLVVAFFVIKFIRSVSDAMAMFGGMQNSASTETIETRDIVNSVTATGKIVAVDKRTISSTVTGVKVKELKVAVGDTVSPGDILCLLDADDLEVQLADATTVMNADASRAGIDLQASNRGLDEAVTSREIDAARASEDTTAAYNQYAGAAEECQEAKDDYDDAVSTTAGAKGKMDGAKRKLDSVAGPKWVTDVAAEEAAQKEIERIKNDYSGNVSELKSYVSALSSDATEGSNVVAGWDANLTGDIDNDIVPSVSQIYSGISADPRGTIDGYIQKLNDNKSEYNNAKQTLLAAQNNKIDANEAARAQAQAEYQQAKATYEAAVAKEESLKANYEAKAKAVENYYDAYNKTVRGADDMKRNDDSAVAARIDGVKNSRINSSTATLGDKRNVTQLQEQIDSCVITANIYGVVTEVDVVQGDMYAGGAILTIENTSEYEVSAQIDEYDIVGVKPGQEVVVKTNGTGSEEFKGVVKSVAPHATQSVNDSVVKYEVIVSVLDKCDDFKLDMTAKIEIIVDKSEGVLAVPTEAIMDDGEGNFYVEVLDSGKTVDTSAMMSDPTSVSEEDIAMLQSGQATYQSHIVYITKGLSGDYYTEISGEGLEEGMSIIVPNEGVMSDLEMYMEEAGAVGGF